MEDKTRSDRYDGTRPFRLRPSLDAINSYMFEHRRHGIFKVKNWNFKDLPKCRPKTYPGPDYNFAGTIIRRKGWLTRNYCIISATSSRYSPPFEVSLLAEPFNKAESALVWFINLFAFTPADEKDVLEGNPSIKLLGVGYDFIKKLYDADKKTFEADYYYDRK